MKLFVERWHALSSWKSLPTSERERWMGEIAPAIEAVTASGVEYLCGGRMDNDAGEVEFVALWRVPSAQAEQGFRDAIAESGWYRYFEQVNLSGDRLDLTELIGALVAF